MRSTQGNEELIKPRMFTCESVPSVCLRDHNGSHKETWEGRTGRRAGIVIHSLISPVSACCLFSHCVTLICCIYLFFSHPLQNDTCQRTSTAPNLSLLFENANSFYLRPAPVSEWVSEWCEVCFARRRSSGVAACRCVLGKCAFRALFSRAVCQSWQHERRCVLNSSMSRSFKSRSFLSQGCSGEQREQTLCANLGLRGESRGALCPPQRSASVVARLWNGIMNNFLFSVPFSSPPSSVLSVQEKNKDKDKRFRPLYDIPYMFEAREFLRKKLIGKKVSLDQTCRCFWKP